MYGGAQGDRMVRRIVALLVAFAGLAERAAGRSWPVRFLILLVLRRAETVARDYVADAMCVDGLWFDDGMENTSSPEDAALLAQRFRLLAEELVAVLDPIGRFGAPLPCREAGPSRTASRAARPAAMAGAPHPAHDTS